MSNSDHQQEFEVAVTPRSFIDNSIFVAALVATSFLLGFIGLVQAWVSKKPGFAVLGGVGTGLAILTVLTSCLLYTSPSPRDRQKSRMPSSA